MSKGTWLVGVLPGCRTLQINASLITARSSSNMAAVYRVILWVPSGACLSCAPAVENRSFAAGI